MEIEKLNNGVISLEGEVWKVINHPSIGDYSNYEISNFGRIKSRNFNNTGKEKLLKGVKTAGYLRVCLYHKPDKQKLFLVHRLVALMFLPNPNPKDKPCINHKIEGDEGKSMNFVFFKQDGLVDLERTTIEWVSHKENTNYATCVERIQQKRKKTIKNSVVWREGHRKRAEKQSKQVFQYRETDLELVSVYVSTREAERQTGFSSGHISACCRGVRKSHKGFIWSYSPLPNTSNQLTLFPTITKVS